MEADWQRRGHPLHDSSTASRPPTLPSVAELIASSTPPAGTIPAYHQPSSSLPPIQCSTQHNSPPTAALANAPSPTEQSYFGAPVRRASHASPTLSAASTAISEPHHYQQPIAQKEPARGVQGMTTESYQSQQDHSPRPISGRRQDSAVSKEGSTFAPPSEPGLSYSHRSPTYSHHSPSSSLAAQLITQPSPPAHSSAASIYPSPAPIDHVTSPVVHSNGHSDHPNTSNTRQQRYNVRFAANYTSANMPPVQRPRQSPPLPAATSPQETNGPPTPPDRPQSPSDLKIHEWLVGPKKKADLNAHPIPNLNDSAGEKCHRCKEVWKRQPLDNASAWAQQETAKSIQDFAKATDKHISGLRQHARDNEVEYEKWKAYHSSGECPIRPSPPPETHFTNGHSNKRKSEGPHSDMPKVPKITHENHGPTAPAIRP